MRDVAENLSRFRGRALAAPPFRDKTIGFEIDVRLDFVREILVRASRTKDGHDPFSGSGPSTRDMAAARRLHFVDSCTSWLRPLLVSE